MEISSSRASTLPPAVKFRCRSSLEVDYNQLTIAAITAGKQLLIVIDWKWFALIMLGEQFKSTCTCDLIEQSKTNFKWVFHRNTRLLGLQ